MLEVSLKHMFRQTYVSGLTRPGDRRPLPPYLVFCVCRCGLALLLLTMKLWVVLVTLASISHGRVSAAAHRSDDAVIVLGGNFKIHAFLARSFLKFLVADVAISDTTTLDAAAAFPSPLSAGPLYRCGLPVMTRGLNRICSEKRHPTRHGDF